MNSCWYEAPDERPSFSELAKYLESMLSNMVGYIELSMALTSTPGDDHGEHASPMQCMHYGHGFKLYIICMHVNMNILAKKGSLCGKIDLQYNMHALVQQSHFS